MDGKKQLTRAEREKRQARREKKRLEAEATQVVGYNWYRENRAPDYTVGDDESRHKFEKEVLAKTPGVFLFVYRNKNKNVVFYEAVIEDGKLVKPYVRGYWIEFTRDAMYEEFSRIDRTLAWGYSATEAGVFKFDRFPIELKVLVRGKTAKCMLGWKEDKHMAKSLHVVACKITPAIIAKVSKVVTFGGSVLDTGVVKTMYFETFNKTRKQKDQVHIVPQN